MDEPISTLVERKAPSDTEAEECVLGCILIDPNAIDDIGQLINEEDFFDPANGTLYQHLRDMRDSQIGIDAMTVVSRLKDAKDLDGIGGVSRIASLIEKVPHANHAAHFAETVRELSVRRSIIVAAKETLQQAYEPLTSQTTEQVLGQAQDRLFTIAERSRGGVSAIRVGDAMEPHIELLELKRQGRIESGLPTGLVDLDGYLQFRNAEVTVLGARPSQGKSAISLNIATSVSQSHSTPTMFVSLEMSTTELMNRYISSRANVNVVRLQRGHFGEAEMGRVLHVAHAAEHVPLTFVDSTTLTVSQISSIARQAVRAGRCRLLVIDYIQLITPASLRDTREQQVSKISRSLKVLARELDIPVLVLAQVNRNAGHDGRAPKLSDLRESGAIEQDADNVFFVHRPSVYQPDLENDTSGGERAELHIAKQRNGPTGVVEVLFQKEYCQFLNLARETEERYAEFDAFNDEAF